MDENGYVYIVAPKPTSKRQLNETNQLEVIPRKFPKIEPNQSPRSRMIPFEYLKCSVDGCEQFFPNTHGDKKVCLVILLKNLKYSNFFFSHSAKIR